MAAFGIKAIQPQDNEHILGFAVARATSDMSLFEVWNGPTSADLRYTLDKDGQHQSAAGTVSRPTYSWEGSKTTGWYRIGADNIGFAVAATKLLDLGAALVGVTGALTVSTTTTFTGVTTHGGNVVSDTDSTDDLGTTGVRWANLWVDDITVTTTVTAGTSLVGGTMTVAAGSLTDSSGAISFGNENLTTTGTLAAGTTTIGTLVLAAASITDTSGALSFGNENLTTTGTLAAGTLTVTGAVLSNADDGGALGASGTGWSDLFLASGAVINFNAGDVTLTHATDTLALAGGSFTITGDTDVDGGFLQMSDGTSAIRLRDNAGAAELLIDGSDGDFTGSDYWIIRTEGASETLDFQNAGAVSLFSIGYTGNVTVAGTLDVAGVITRTGAADLTGITVSAGTTTRPAVRLSNDTTGELAYMLGTNDKGFQVFVNGGATTGLTIDPSGNHTIPGTLAVTGDIGFYGQAATAKPTGVAVSAAGIHAALVTLNLIAA